MQDRTTKILITGGAGFIGRHIAQHFQGKAEVRVLDNLRSGFKRNLDGLTVAFSEGSILDREIVRHNVQGVDYIFHLAAMVSVPESVEKPDECARINLEGTRILLEEAAQAGVKKLVFSSSAAIYGDDPALPKREEMPAQPKSPYGATKYEGEQLGADFAKSGRLDTVSLRYFNVFGPFQNPKSDYAAAVPAFITKALRDEPITIYGDGTQTRDFIYVKDVAAANAFFATQSEATGVFNVACGDRLNITNVARTIQEIAGSQKPIENGPARPGDIKHSAASIEKMKAAGFTPRYGLTEGLRETIDYFRASTVW